MSWGTIINVAVYYLLFRIHTHAKIFQEAFCFFLPAVYTFFRYQIWQENGKRFCSARKGEKVKEHEEQWSRASLFQSVGTVLGKQLAYTFHISRNLTQLYIRGDAVPNKFLKARFFIYFFVCLMMI